MQIVVINSALDAAWAAYDAARVREQKLYEVAVSSGDTQTERLARCEASIDAVRCHRKWTEIFLASDQNPTAA